jgi:hypothetical protein
MARDDKPAARASSPNVAASDDAVDLGIMAREIAEIRRDLGRMPGTHGIDDEGEGGLRLLWELRAQFKRGQRRQHAVSALVAGVLVGAVQIVNAYGGHPQGAFVPAPPDPPPHAAPLR